QRFTGTTPDASGGTDSSVNLSDGNVSGTWRIVDSGGTVKNSAQNGRSYALGQIYAHNNNSVEYSTALYLQPSTPNLVLHQSNYFYGSTTYDVWVKYTK
ncbi:MAG: hypothetical protein LBK50_03315, partial [Candidatus Nomurabacteria bacterium]|nr:hypothetical protein [Candidatus Nomurabacteria bacterium]